MTERNFVYLLAGLLLLLVAAPLASFLLGDGSEVLIHAAFTALLVVGLWSLTRDRRLFAVSLAFGVIAVGLTILGVAREDDSLFLVAQGFVLLFCVLMAGAAIHQVFLTPGVDFNTVVGALCIYLLVGVIWAILYRYLEAFAPGSINGIANDGTPTQTLLYFSFVTLTTLGYGDIAPISPFARALTTLEAIVGQLYLAVMVAGLVGAHVAARGRS